MADAADAWKTLPAPVRAVSVPPRPPLLAMFCILFSAQAQTQAPEYLSFHNQVPVRDQTGSRKDK